MKKQHAISPMIIFLLITFAFIFIYSLLAPVLYPIDLGATDIINRLTGLSPQHLLRMAVPSIFLALTVLVVISS